METVVKQARTARHSQFVACGANMSPEKFKTSFGFKDRCMLIEAPGREIPSCRSKCPNGKTIERTYDYVFASQSLQANLRTWKWQKTSNQDDTRRLLFWWKEARRFRTCAS